MKRHERRRAAHELHNCASVRRAPWANSRRGRLIAVVAIAAFAVTGGIAGQPAGPAYAIDYPTWDDVQNARNSESAKQGEITRIRDFLAQLATNVAETQEVAITRGEEMQLAQEEFDEADFKAQQLQLQADEAQVTADGSKLRAGQLAARLSRSGGDVSASLFFDSESADDLLSQLGMASKITDQSAGIYTKATQDQNTAQSLTDQADVAKIALEELAEVAAAALEAANAAVDAADAALQEQEANKVVLEQQLVVLSENREATEADFMVGERARQAEAARLAELARQALAAQAQARAAAAAAAPASGGGGGGGGTGGAVSASGWANPVSGRISSSFGNRVHPVTGAFSFHAGTDIAASCGTPIFAAQSGTVTYAGPNGNFGNFVSISGSGVTTAYAHMLDGGIVVRRGQTVQAGDLISRVGNSGRSTGCHLHFEVRVGASVVDPVGFMGARNTRVG